MKKHNLTRILVLVLSFALLIGSALVITAAAESTENDKLGTFGGISLAYKDTVSIVVEVKATQEQIEKGDVVVSYSVNGFEGNATFYKEVGNGYVRVITEGIAAYNFAEIVTFSSTLKDGTKVEENRTYSVAEFLYRQLHLYGADEKYTALYNSIIAYGKAMSDIVEDDVNDITKSTLVFTNNENVTVNGKKFAFAPGADIEVTPVYNGELGVGKVLEGWNIIDNGEEKVVDLTFKASKVVEIVSPVIGDEDATKFTLVNGGFENGLDGWTLVGNIGGVSSDANYWLNDPESADGFAFGKDGGNMFSAYAEGATEGAVGTLTSSTFIVGGTGYVTFKLGAMKNGGSVYVDVVDAETDAVLVRYYNNLWAERTNGVKSGCTLVPYKADLTAFMGKEVYFRITDNADSDYGLFFADSFNTYHTTVPGNDYNLATPGSIYELFNGGFELGDIRGWQNDGAPGLVTGADNYFDGTAYGKDGNFLYSGVQDQGGAFLEDRRGTLTSSVFEIGGTGYISFMLGGGGNALCYVQVIDASTNEVLARYHQQAQQGGTLIQYVADLSKYIGRTARIQVVDYASNDWGCVSFDNVVTYYPAGEALPEGAITANDIFHGVYDVTNGSFETGNLDGWTMNITEEGKHNTLGWVMDHEADDAGWYTRNDGNLDGNYLFTFLQQGDVNCESSKGTLESSRFALRSGAFVSFRFGGAGGGQNHDVFIQLVKADGTVIATFFNDAEGKVNTRMNAYYYQYTGETADCFFRVVDNSTGDYGCFVVDDFRVNLGAAPEGFIAAIQ